MIMHFYRFKIIIFSSPLNFSKFIPSSDSICFSIKSLISGGTPIRHKEDMSTGISQWKHADRQRNRSGISPLRMIMELNEFTHKKLYRHYHL